MKFPSFVKDAQRLLDKNSPQILTAVAIVGVGATAYLSHRAALNSERQLNEQIPHEYIDRDPTQFEVVQMVWKHYIPPVVVGVGTSTCMYMATKIGLNRTAAMAAAFAISERTYDQYKEKAKEHLTDSKQAKIKEQIAQDQVSQTPVPSTLIIMGDDVLFLDDWSQRFFTSTMEKVQKAVNEINHEAIFGGYASLSNYYDRVGLSHTPESDNIGWNADTPLTIDTPVVLKDGKPCVVVSFDPHPRAGFSSPHP